MSTSSSANWASAWSRGRKVLVTGGTGGIGGAIADAFLDAGAEVISTGATEPELEAARAARPGMEHRLLDVRDTEAVRGFMSELGSLDVVVNCAGIIRRGDELDADVFARVIDINLTGTMRVCEAARPLLAQSRGSIINIASMLSIFGGGLVPGYSASKGGISQLTKSLAIAYASDGIRVNAVAPGWIATPLTEALQNDPSRAQPILSRTPMARWGTPGDLQGIALFLASSHAAFMTGTVIPVDGGYSIM